MSCHLYSDLPFFFWATRSLSHTPAQGLIIKVVVESGGSGGQSVWVCSFSSSNIKTCFLSSRGFRWQGDICVSALLCDSSQWMMRTWQCWHRHNTLDLPWKCAVANPQRDIKVFCIEVEAEGERGMEVVREVLGNCFLERVVFWWFVCRSMSVHVFVCAHTNARFHSLPYDWSCDLISCTLLQLLHFLELCFF